MSYPAFAFLPGSGQALWSYDLQGTGAEFPVLAPAVRIDNSTVLLSSSQLNETPTIGLPNGTLERRFLGPVSDNPHLTIELILRCTIENPIVRFRYRLHANRAVKLTNDEANRNDLQYLGLDLCMLREVTELRFSTFLEPVHSSFLEEVPVPASYFENGLRPMGPLLTAYGGNISLIVGYEHGSQFPNKFLEFRLQPNHTATINAVKGNYFHGRIISPGNPFETVWFQLGVIKGNRDTLASVYRDFVLRWQSPNRASRKPWIFYNTWNYQERLKHIQQRPYLAEMNNERILAEIDVAHRIGIDVFVIDTGWYCKTGDWRVDQDRFHDGLRSIKAALDALGMRLGLWFNPTIAALSSDMWIEHQDCIQEWQGERHPPKSHWEGTESQDLCPVSRYADAYASEMLRLIQDLGVTYFKWDAIEQEGPSSCDAAGHDHGGFDNPSEERNACYGFEQVRFLTKIVDKVCAELPEAIFDFDITERGRSVGLAFLAAGKYFLINNGPYHWNYDIPSVIDNNPNLFFHPGPARAWICRTPLTYDKWIPSVLFLTHYLPDSPIDSQFINAVSLMLGQNGIWGDLLSMDEGSVTRWRQLITLYKQVRYDVVSADPVRVGHVGGDPEIHEKIAANGCGLVAIFASAKGSFDYITRATNVAIPTAGMDGIEARRDEKGRAVIRATFERASAKVVFFRSLSPNSSFADSDNMPDSRPT